MRVNADLRTLTEVWMGDRPMSEALDDRSIELLGPTSLVRAFPQWLGHHPVLGGVARAGA
jgi:hypothetical protein